MLFSQFLQAMVGARSNIAFITGLFLLISTTSLLPFTHAAEKTQADPERNWSSYGGSGGQQYSALTQINPASLKKLGLAWSSRTGELGQGFTDDSFSFQANPVYWDKRLFVSTATGVALAFNAATGEELWR